MASSDGANIAQIAQIELATLKEPVRKFPAKELWEKDGAVLMLVRRPG